MSHGKFRLFNAGLLTMALSAIGALTMFASSGASATPVPFSITSAQFVPGSGYGLDIDEVSGVATLLDVRFSTAAFAQQNFALSAVNQSFTFNFGSVDLEEPDAHAGIVAAELDNLDIAAKLTFTAPTGVVQTVIANGLAFPGSVSDSFVDYVIDWSPVTILFGNGGAFRVSLTDLSLDGMGPELQTVTITLLSLSDDGAGTPRDTNLPEPASIALLGIGIAGIGLTRRRKLS